MPAGLNAAATLASAVAQACTFAATVPLFARGSVMRVVRAGLALALVPVLVQTATLPLGRESALDAVVRGSAIGAAFGLSALAVSGAAAAAGSLIDAGLVWAPVADSSRGGGAVAFLYQLAFGVVFVASGGFSALIELFVRAGAHVPAHALTPSWVLALGTASVRASLGLAAPALLAQALAALFAGVVARAAPQVNGMLVSAPLIGTAVGVALVAGAGVLFAQFANIVRELLALSGSG